MYPYQKLSREMGHPSICMLLLFGCKLKFAKSKITVPVGSQIVYQPYNPPILNVDFLIGKKIVKARAFYFTRENPSCVFSKHTSLLRT